MNFSVNIGSIKFSTPITTAAGTFAFNKQCLYKDVIDALGSITPKTVTLHPRQGNPSPRIVETPSGMINAIGIENPGIDAFFDKDWANYKSLNKPIILSVSGGSQEEWVVLADKVQNRDNLVAVELNLSCPNLGHKTLIAQDTKAIHDVISAVKKKSNISVIAKLSPNVSDITEIAKAAEDAGADGLSLINTLQAMDIDINKRVSRLGNIVGGLSGPAIRPVAVCMVYKVSKAVKIPIIAMGGILTAEDALQFIIAGATKVAIGTGCFVDPKAAVNVLSGIKDYLIKHNIDDIKSLIGSLNS